MASIQPYCGRFEKTLGPLAVVLRALPDDFHMEIAGLIAQYTANWMQFEGRQFLWWFLDVPDGNDRMICLCDPESGLMVVGCVAESVEITASSHDLDGARFQRRYFIDPKKQAVGICDGYLCDRPDTMEDADLVTLPFDVNRPDVPVRFMWKSPDCFAHLTAVSPFHTAMTLDGLAVVSRRNFMAVYSYALGSMLALSADSEARTVSIVAVDRYYERDATEFFWASAAVEASGITIDLEYQPDYHPERGHHLLEFTMQRRGAEWVEEKNGHSFATVLVTFCAALHPNCHAMARGAFGIAQRIFQNGNFEKVLEFVRVEENLNAFVSDGGFRILSLTRHLTSLCS